MNQRALLALALGAATLLAPGCASDHRHDDDRGEHAAAARHDRWLHHDVYFELADDSPESVARLEDDCWSLLADLPGIQYFATGTPAAELDREFNDRDFDLVLHVAFESLEAHDAYQVSAPHQELIARYGASFTRVRVFDAWGPGRAIHERH